MMTTGLALDVVEGSVPDKPMVGGQQQDIKALRQKVERLQDENATLREWQSRRGDADTTTASEVQLKATLKQARSDVVCVDRAGVLMVVCAHVCVYVCVCVCVHLHVCVTPTPALPVRCS